MTRWVDIFLAAARARGMSFDGDDDDGAPADDDGSDDDGSDDDDSSDDDGSSETDPVDTPAAEIPVMTMVISLKDLNLPNDTSPQNPNGGDNDPAPGTDPFDPVQSAPSPAATDSQPQASPQPASWGTTPTGSQGLPDYAGITNSLVNYPSAASLLTNYVNGPSISAAPEVFYTPSAPDHSSWMFQAGVVVGLGGQVTINFSPFEVYFSGAVGVSVGASLGYAPDAQAINSQDTVSLSGLFASMTMTTSDLRALLTGDSSVNPAFSAGVGLRAGVSYSPADYSTSLTDILNSGAQMLENIDRNLKDFYSPINQPFGY